MEHSRGNKKAVILRAVTLCMLLTSGLIFSAYTTVSEKLTSSINRSGISESVAQREFLESMIRKSFNTTSFSSLKKVALAERPAVAKELFAYVRHYVSTEDFLKEYQQVREQNRPTAQPIWMSQQEKSIKRENYIQAIRLFTEAMAGGPKDEQANIKKQIALVQRQLDQLNDPNEALNQWQKDFPASPSDFINDALTNFLEQTEDINFDAVLKESKCNGKVRFVNPVYESKPDMWKMCFRAGKETTITIRNLALQWKQELDQNKISGNP